MNLGDGQATNGVAAVLRNDDDDAVDPHLERIKTQAGGEESDEEVFLHFSNSPISLLILADLVVTLSFVVFRMKILLQRKMIAGLLLMILERRNLMPVKVEMKDRYIDNLCF